MRAVFFSLLVWAATLLVSACSLWNFSDYGGENQACYADKSCNDGLLCQAGLCVRASTDGDSDADSDKETGNETADDDRDSASESEAASENDSDTDGVETGERDDDPDLGDPDLENDSPDSEADGAESETPEAEAELEGDAESDAESDAEESESELEAPADGDSDAESDADESAQVCNDAECCAGGVPVESGAPCGAGPSQCSLQDTCDGKGHCQANHLPDFRSCDDGNSCSNADLCDGNGGCSGLAYTCHGHGSCVGDGTCVCDGFTIGGAQCDRCAVGFSGYPACNLCTPGYDNYPVCDRCTATALGVYPLCFAPGPGYCAGSACYSPVRTGQSVCYDTSDAITCPDRDSGLDCGKTEYCGQDAQYQRISRDIPSRSFICSVNDVNSGNCGTAIYSDETAYDSLTKLEWQRTAIQERTWQQAATYCDVLTYGGHSDWRLPGPLELESIIDLSHTSPAVDPASFPEAPATCFWSSLSLLHGTNQVWSVDFNAGSMEPLDAGTPCAVRCVRQSPEQALGSESRWHLTGVSEPVVLDYVTTLQWQPTATNAVTWKEALAFCESLDYAQQKDWRVPSSKELLALANLTKSEPASEFPNLLSSAWFWSSTTFMSSKAWVWLSGKGSLGFSDKNAKLSVLCVRGGANLGCDEGNPCTAEQYYDSLGHCSKGMSYSCNGLGACNGTGGCICDNPHQEFHCEFCNYIYTNYPACDQCNTLYANYPACDKCAGLHTNYPSCNRCTYPLIGYPKCEQCEQRHGNYPNCDSCRPQFANYPACDQCASGSKGVYPNCALVSVAAGTYSIGEFSSQHTVELTVPFEISPYETTELNFRQFMSYSPSSSTWAGDYPILNVTWHEALAYANAVSAFLGYDPCFSCSGSEANTVCTLKPEYAKPQDCPGYRLPTDAEWEVAARAGSTTDLPNGSLTTSSGSSCGPDYTLDYIGQYCYRNDTYANDPNWVGVLMSNDWGLYDTAGNAAEWVWDWYAAYVAPYQDPSGPTSGTRRVVRGGSYRDAAYDCRSAARGQSDPSQRNYSIGFRLARSLPGTSQ